MGANAQTAVPAFTAGQVLTAAQMTEVNTGIPVFATTVTRDAAFGGSGEKVLAQGQYAYIESTSSLQVYTGAAWVTTGQTAGLACVKAETAFSAVASFSADNVFTSAYTNYAIMVNFTGTTGGVASLQLRVGGVAAATNYNYQRIELTGATSTTSRILAATSLAFGYGSTGAFNQTFKVDVFQPAIATATSFNSAYGAADTSYAFPSYFLQNGNHSTATAYDGFAITVASGTLSGSYTIYGYSKVVS
jgi:hypothetical protein